MKYFGYKHWTLEKVPRCFYVGKGKHKRSHQFAKRNHKWTAIMKRYGIRVEICVGPMTNEEACAWEIENIQIERTFTTDHSHDNIYDIGCNLTKGGEGTSGHKRPDLGLRNKERLTGTHLSEERKRFLSEINKNKVVDKDVAKRISEKLRNRKFSDEAKENMRIAARGRKMPKRTIEHRQKHAESLRGKKRSEETKRNMKDAWKKRKEKLLNTLQEDVVDNMLVPGAFEKMFE